MGRALDLKQIDGDHRTNRNLLKIDHVDDILELKIPVGRAKIAQGFLSNH